MQPVSGDMAQSVAANLWLIVKTVLLMALLSLSYFRAGRESHANERRRRFSPQWRRHVSN